MIKKTSRSSDIARNVNSADCQLTATGQAANCQLTAS